MPFKKLALWDCGMRASGTGGSFAMIPLSGAILNHKPLRNRKKTTERNPSSVSSQHKSWSLQGQTRPYRSPTSCKVLLLLIAARRLGSSSADHTAQVFVLLIPLATPSPAPRLRWGWRTVVACVTRTRRRKSEATLCLPCCILCSNDTIWHHKHGLFIFPLSAQLQTGKHFVLC